MSRALRPGRSGVVGLLLLLLAGSSLSGCLEDGPEDEAEPPLRPDVTSPQLAVELPADGAAELGPFSRMGGCARDPAMEGVASGTDTESLELELDGAPLTAERGGDCILFVPREPLDSGPYELALTARDLADPPHEASWSWTFDVAIREDFTACAVTEIVPEDGGTLDEGDVVDVVIQDPSGLGDILLHLDGRELSLEEGVEPTAYGLRWSPPDPLTDGEHVLRVDAWDASSQRNACMRTWSVTSAAI